MSSLESVQRSFRSMALICAILGPVTLILAAGGAGLSIVAEHLVANAPRGFDKKAAADALGMLHYARDSVWIVALLSVGLTVAGLEGLRRPVRGRVWLAIAGWFWVAGSVALAGMAVIGSDTSRTSGAVAAGNLIQALLIARACVFLHARRTREAVSSCKPGAPAPWKSRERQPAKHVPRPDPDAPNARSAGAPGDGDPPLGL